MIRSMKFKTDAEWNAALNKAWGKIKPLMHPAISAAMSYRLITGKNVKIKIKKGGSK